MRKFVFAHSVKDGRSETGNAAEVAEAVRRFYDRHPYPPPVDNLKRERQRWNDGHRRRADAHLFWPAEAYRDDRSILVAGCGTSQAAKYALRWPHASVTGIDVSETSLRETDALKRKYRLENLWLHRLAVERAIELGRTFEHVVCTGVLHHLPDPEAGLAALRDVLDPSGVLHLMVYAPYGRAGVYLLQEYCRRLGIRSDQDIGSLVASLRALPQDHPFAALLRHAPDLQHPAGLADALLHPNDRAYSVPQLLQLLGRCGFRFGRWLRQAPYLPHCGALAASPHRPLLAGLPTEEQYAAVELFRGTMIRHTAVVYRDDHPRNAGHIDFHGTGWLDYAPFRVPDTIAVTERLPPGAATVLINPKHTYTDLYLPIGPQEVPLFDAIDGVRTIRAIAEKTGRLETARDLFERLWWYDQVVFDASGCA
jgi:SAM-dependent methyltransferase